MKAEINCIDFLESQYDTNKKLTPVDFYQAREILKKQCINTAKKLIKKELNNFSKEIETLKTEQLNNN